MRITPLQPHLAARVDDVDLAAPLDERAFRQIYDAFQAHSVLVFHDQRLTDAEQMAFSARFGPLETTIKAPGKENRYDKHSARYPRVMRRTTVAGDGPTAQPPFATGTPAWDGIIPEGVGAVA